MSQAYVILDRDGVINVDSADFIKSADEWQAIPGSIEAIAELSRHGFKIAVLTNQSGVGRGLFDLQALDAMHDKMLDSVRALGGDIEAIYFCPHGPQDGCACRKPKPGLFLQLAREHEVDLSRTYAVGDSGRDLQAAIRAGAKPILVKTGKGLKTLADYPNPNFPVFENLYDAARFIIAAR
jgi:D-glycero-D-manno-heptose 1,7-bisphosphate phosphatase